VSAVGLLGRQKIRREKMKGMGLIPINPHKNGKESAQKRKRSCQAEGGGPREGHPVETTVGE
jgi:hypothetical protein